MAFNGSGTFVRTTGTYTGATAWAQEAAAGNNIEAATFDTHDQDIATALSSCLVKDGQQTPSANLPMGGFKHTGVADGSARTHYASVGQLQDCTVVFAVSGGAANAQTLTLTPAITAYVDGFTAYFKAGFSNSSSCTMNINGVGAVTVRHYTGADVRSGDIVSGRYYAVIYGAAANSFYLFNPSFPLLENVNITGLSASTLVATDGNKTLTSSVTGLSPTFTGLNLSGLTASRVVTTDGSKNLATDTIQSITNSGLAQSSYSIAAATANGGSTLTVGTVSEARYFRVGPDIFFDISFQFTLAGGTPTTITIPAPASGTAHGTNDAFIAGADETADATKTTCRWRYNGTDIIAFLPGLATWATSGTNSIHIQGRYKV